MTSSLTIATVALSVEFDLKIESEANLRGKWQRHAARKKKHKRLGMLHTRSVVGLLALVARGTPITILLTRIRPPEGRNLDDDNLAGGFKAVRDGVAAAIGIDDGSDRLAWRYAQAKGVRYAVRIEITAGPPPAEPTHEQADIIRHSLGLTSGRNVSRRKPVPNRNQYCTEDGDPKLEQMVEAGFMRRANTINDGRDRYYVVTESGAAAVGSHLPKD